ISVKKPRSSARVVRGVMVIPVSMVIVSGVAVLSFNSCYWWWGRRQRMALKKYNIKLQRNDIYEKN
ncbi:MAG: hypothetical protein WCE81_01090, partial [Halobacteriota archaeon]